MYREALEQLKELHLNVSRSKPEGMPAKMVNVFERLVEREEFFRRAFEILAQKYGENRDDVCEYVWIVFDPNSTLEERLKLLEDFKPEDRFVKFKYRGITFLYDNLTRYVETDGDPLPQELLPGGNHWKILQTESIEGG